MKQFLRTEYFLAVILLLPAYASAQDAAPKPAPVPAAPGPAAPEPAAAPADALPGYFAEERKSITTEVVAVDPKTRIIMLREEGQEPQAFTVDKEVRNLDQVKPGDRVKVDSYQSTSLKVLPPGELGDEDIVGTERSQPGEKPGGVAVRQRTITVKVSSIFPESKEFLTRNAKGQLRTWKVKDAKDLEKIKSGDRIQLTSVSTLAVSVTPAPPEAITAGATTRPTNAPAADPAKAPGAEAEKASSAEPAKTPAEPTK